MATKKGHKKKVVKKQRRHVFKDAHPDLHFWLIDGSSIKNVRELAERLDKISDDVFHYHVTEAKNDFSSWIHDVFDEKELAKEVKKMKKRVDAQVSVLKHLVKELSKL